MDSNISGHEAFVILNDSIPNLWLLLTSVQRSTPTRIVDEKGDFSFAVNDLQIRVPDAVGAVAKKIPDASFWLGPGFSGAKPSAKATFFRRHLGG